MDQVQKARALEAMKTTPGWKVLEGYLEKHSTPTLLPVENLDSLIKQAYLNGLCQGYKDVLKFVKITIDTAKRKNK